MKVANELGYPIVLKIVSPQITHKSDVGGVALNLTSADEVAAAYDRVVASPKQARAQRDHRGRRRPAHGAAGHRSDRRHEQGPAVRAGDDVRPRRRPGRESSRTSPSASCRSTSATRARWSHEIKGYPLLEGYRGQDPADIARCEQLLLKLSPFIEAPRGRGAGPEPGVRLQGRRDRGRCAHRPRLAARRDHPQEHLRRVLKPRTQSVVVGSKRADGYMWLRNYGDSRAATLYSVQIDPNEIPGIEAMGVTNFTSLMDVPGDVDYVMLAVPRPVAARVIADCAKKGVGGVALFTSGLRRDGRGRRHRDAGASAADRARRQHALIGPNCMGLYNRRLGIRQAATRAPARRATSASSRRAGRTPSTSASSASSTACASARPSASATRSCSTCRTISTTSPTTRTRK